MTGIPQGPVSPMMPGQPPQGPQGPMGPPMPPQGIVPPRVPDQQANMPAVTMGPDSPPAMGQIGNPQGGAAPPAWDGWYPPRQMPGNFSEQQMVIDRMKQEFQNMMARNAHQSDLDVQQGIQEAPGQAKQLMQDIRMKPGEDFDEQIKSLKGSLPPSVHKNLRTSHDRIRKMRGGMSDYKKEITEHLRKDFKKDVYKEGSDVANLKKQVGTEDEWKKKIVAANDAYRITSWREPEEQKRAKALIEQLHKERPEVDVESKAASVGMSDISRGLGSIVTGDEGVQDQMLRELRDIGEKYLPAAKSQNPMEVMAEYQKVMLGMSKKGGFSRETWRAALADVAIKTVGDLKRDTEDADLLGNVAGALPWVATGIGEVALAGKAVKAVVKAAPWIAKSGKLGKAGLKMEKLMTYAAGPALMDFSYGYVRDLPGHRQAELDTIEDPKLKTATEEAYRFQTATLDATMAVVFSTTSLAKRANRLPQFFEMPSSKGRAAVDVLKVAGLAPGAVEYANMLIGEGATKLAGNDTGAADVLRDMYAAKEMYGPIHRFMEAKTADERWAAAKEYAKQTLPLMAGIGSAHAMAALGGRFKSRPQMLEAFRDVKDDINKQNLSPEAKEQLQIVMKKQLEDMAPSEKEDFRAADRRTVAERHGDAAENAIKAEALSGELLGDVRGRHLDEKLPNLEPNTREGRIGDLLNALRRTTDPDRAAQLVGEIRNLDTVDPGPLDVAADNGRLQDNIAEAEDDAVNDEALARAAEAADTEWIPVGRDDDAGTVTLRQDVEGDAPVRITVKEGELGSYRIADGEGDPVFEPNLQADFDARDKTLDPLAVPAFRKNAEYALRTTEEGTPEHSEAKRDLARIDAAEAKVKGLEGTGRALSADPKWAKDVPELADLQSGKLTPQRFANAVVKRLDAEGPEAWRKLHDNHPELRGTKRVKLDKVTKKPVISKKKIKQQLLSQAKDIAEQSGKWTRPAKPSTKHLRKAQGLVGWLVKAGGMTEAQWIASGIDINHLRGHQYEKQLIRADSKNQWEHLSSALNETGWMGRDSDAIGGMNAEHATMFPQMVTDALFGEHVTSLDENVMSDNAMDAMEAAQGGGRAPAPEGPRIIGDATEKVIDAIKAGATSGRLLQEATGLSRERAGKVLKQMFDDGMLVKKGNGYELAADAGEGMTPESVARRDEADQITQRLLGDAQALAHDIERGGAQVLDDRGPRMAQDIADYGDLVRPDDPQIASAEMVSRVLLEVAPDDRTDALIRKLGMGETDVAVVREFMRQREEPTAPYTQQTSLSPEVITSVDAALEGRTRLDLAMKSPQLDALSDGVRDTFEESVQIGVEPDEAATFAWDTWHYEIGGKDAPHTLEEEITAQSKHLASINRDIVSLKTAKHAKALEDLGKLVGAVRDNDEWTGMLSLHSGGRAYLKQLNALWHAATVRREVPMMPGMTVKEAKRKAMAKKLSDHRRAEGRDGERGSIINPGVVLIKAADAAAAIMGAAKRTFGKVWSMSWRAITKGINLLKKPGVKLMDLMRHSTHGERVANRIEIRASTTISKNVGKKRTMLLVDNLTKWGEVDLILTYEKAAFNAKIAHEAASRINRIIKEDSNFDLSLNRALELLGVSPENRLDGDNEWLDTFQGNLTNEQADVVDALGQMYGQLRELVAGELLPTQQQRRRDMALLDDLVSEAKALTEVMDQEWARAMEVGDKPTQRKAKTAHDKAAKKWLDAENRLGRLRGEALREKEQWGITDRGFAPAVPNKDPSEALARAISEGRLSEAEIRMGDIQEALRDLPTTTAKLRERAHDFIHGPIPPSPRAGHWMARKGTLEAAGAREQSALRSFFHYVKEVYRLIPAAQWHERNYDRLWGEEKWVSATELDAGMLDGGGHVVEYIADQVPASARKRTHYRLGGKAYGINLINPVTKRVEQRWFRSQGDAKNALKADWGDWKLAAKQNLSKHYMLMHHEARPGAEVDVPLIGTDKKTKQLMLSNHDVKYVLPTNAVGSYIKKVGGKYAAIRKMEGGGKKQANEFAAYVDQGLQRIMGRELLTKWERFGAAFSSLVRHKLLGAMQLSSAIKESMDNFNAYALHSGVEGAADASHYAFEFSNRMRLANVKLNKLSAGDWLLQHTPDEGGDVVPKMLSESIRTTQKKLDAMSPEKRADAQMEDDAYVAFLHSALSGDSINEHLGVVKRRDGFGKKLFLSSGAEEPGLKGKVKHGREIAGRLGMATGDASWYMRRRAQGYGMRMTWIGAYMTQRKVGKSNAEATEIANNFALSQGNVGNRLSQAEFFQKAWGRMIKPLAAWSLATSATNFRLLFHHSGNAGVKMSMVGKRMAYYAAMIYSIEQMGILADLDMGNSIGGKVSQVPLVGPMAAYSAQELLHKMELAADPADASRELPQWRQDAMALAREHAPDFLREYLVRRGADLGGFPADVPIPMLAGTWSPYVADAANDFFTILTTSDDKRRAQAKHNLTGANFDWMRAWNRLYQTAPDPSDPNYLLVKNPNTGHMQQRVKKGDEGAAIWNLLMPDIETAVRRIERSVLQPRRDELRASMTRNAAFKAQKSLIEADRIRDEMRQMESPEQQKVAQDRIDALNEDFRDQVRAYGKERGLQMTDLVSTAARWTKVAKANLSLTSRERDIINAYDTDTAFRMWTAAMDDVGDPMTRQRFAKVMSLRYSSPKTMFKALAKQKKDTVERFMRSYKTSLARWNAGKR